MLKVKVIVVGNSMGILLPKEALGKLNAERGGPTGTRSGPVDDRQAGNVLERFVTH